MFAQWRSMAAVVRLSKVQPQPWRRLSTTGASSDQGLFRLPPSVIRIDDEVREALSSGSLERNRVVALETAVVTHGLPYPQNVETALAMEDEIRIQGAIPATICIIDGKINVGCQLQQLERLGKSNEPKLKVSRRDFAFALSQRLNGGTTVAGTLVVAKAMGIRLFATGGIGGVHRGGEVSMDVSADLVELGRSPVAVISAGVKSILDIPRTLEYLETQGVFVATLTDAKSGSPKFPNFFEQESEVESPAILRGERAAADLLDRHFSLGMDAGVLLAVPVPKEYENKDVARLISEASAECEKRGIRGRDVTPFILNRIREGTAGSSVLSNQALLVNNARVAGWIGSLLAGSREGVNQKERLRAGRDAEPAFKSSEKNPAVVVGGAAVDFLVKVKDDIVNDGRTHWSTMEQTVGGVGRNVAQCLKELGVKPLFIAAVGSDATGKKVRSDLNTHLAPAGDSVKLVSSGSTTSFIIVLDRFGQHFFEAGDAECLNQLSVEHVKKFEESLQHAPLVFIDGNIPLQTMDYVLRTAKSSHVPVFFEPTTSSLAHKPFVINRHDCLTFASPNIAELFQMNLSLSAAEKMNQSVALDPALVERFHADPHFVDKLPFDAKMGLLISLVKPFVQDGSMKVLLVTMGRDGLLIARKGSPDDELLPTAKDREQDQRMTLTHYPAEKMNCIASVSGAGDCLAGGFITAMLARKPQHFCAAFAQLCARASLGSNSTVPNNFSLPYLREQAEALSGQFVTIPSTT